MVRKKINLFTTAFLQVFFVSGNTYFISQQLWAGIAVFGFSISYLWTLNVKKIAVAGMIDRVIYSSGAMIGGMVGVFVSSLINQYLKK